MFLRSATKAYLSLILLSQNYLEAIRIFLTKLYIKLPKTTTDRYVKFLGPEYPLFPFYFV